MYNKTKPDGRPNDGWAESLAIMGELEELTNFLDTLPEQPECHTVEDWMQHIKNADQLTRDIFSKGPYDVLYDALNYPFLHCYNAIKEFGELCFQTGVKSVKQEQPVEIHIDNPNIQKFDPNIKVEIHTDGTRDINGKAMLYVADKSYKIGFRDGKASKEQSMEGLEEAAKDRVTENGRFPISEFEELRIRDIEFGAEWQKVQDQKTIELAEDHAMLAGMNMMEQQMIEKAYDTIMQFDELNDLVPTFEDMQKFGFKQGDKVKVIIFKEK